MSRIGSPRMTMLIAVYHHVLVANKISPSLAWAPSRPTRTCLWTKSQDKMENTKESKFKQGSLASLCDITKRACDAVAPMIVAFYESLGSETKKLKDDNSAFTIADGSVQYLFIKHLFSDNENNEFSFRNIVGEEDNCDVNFNPGQPYTVDNLVISQDYVSIVDQARNEMTALRKELLQQWNQELYGQLTVFLDPIDGTREFSTGKGEQCSICVGFADSQGHAVAGVVYRPIGLPTWASGAHSEDFVDSNLNYADEQIQGILTTNGSISPFVNDFIQDKLKWNRIKSGGAGNKMLMLLEGRGAAYIQDRGVSRWDTCAAQACLEARGGLLCKLSSFLNEEKLACYTYLLTERNLDFEPGVCNLTRYNSANGDYGAKAMHVKQVKPYANLCGLIALSPGLNTATNKENLYKALKDAASEFPPSFD